MEGEKMNFPISPYEFLLDYSIKDEKEVYTNGALLIPTFRAKQAFEHYFEKQSKWIPVSEALPPRDENVLAYHRNESFDYQYVSWIDDYSGKWAGFIGNLPDEVLAWMPLPEPYKAESGDKE